MRGAVSPDVTGPLPSDALVDQQAEAELLARATGAGSAAGGPNTTGAGSAASGPNDTDAGSDASGPQERRVSGFEIVEYSTPRGNAAAYYPETNPLVPLGSVAKGSNTPVSKAVVIRLEPATT